MSVKTAPCGVASNVACHSWRLAEEGRGGCFAPGAAEGVAEGGFVTGEPFWGRIVLCMWVLRGGICGGVRA